MALTNLYLRILRCAIALIGAANRGTAVLSQELSPRSNEKRQRNSQSTTGYQDKQESVPRGLTDFSIDTFNPKIPRKIKVQGWPLFKGETTNDTDPWE